MKESGNSDSFWLALFASGKCLPDVIRSKKTMDSPLHGFTSRCGRIFRSLRALSLLPTVCVRWTILSSFVFCPWGSPPFADPARDHRVKLMHDSFEALSRRLIGPRRNPADNLLTTNVLVVLMASNAKRTTIVLLCRRLCLTSARRPISSWISRHR